jgi:hypothetical protein
MEKEIKYVKNKDYIYVISNNEYNDKKLDVSIFEIKDWENLLEISKVFKETVSYVNGVSDNSYKYLDKNLKSYTYFLYNSPFCHYESFNDLEYEIKKLEDIYEVVFHRLESGEKITINEFRKWIVENYEKINERYEYLKKKIKNL